MEINELKKPTAKVEKYSLEKLLNDILDSTDESYSEKVNNEKTKREHRAKKVVIQTLIELANEYGTAIYKNEEKLINALEIKVCEDKWMSGYMFYVSRNPNFDYSWNYMRKQIDGYIEFLGKAVRYFTNIVEDINSIANKLVSDEYIHVVFSNIINVASPKGEPRIKASLIWENFNSAESFNSNYQITVKREDVILIIGTRKNSASVSELIIKSNEQFNNKDTELK